MEYAISRLRTTKWAIGAAAILLSTISAEGSAAQSYDTRSAEVLSEEFEKVDAYLSRLGLTEQRILLSEAYIEKPISPASRRQALRDLADLFALRLIEVSGDEAKFDAYRRRVQKLIDKYPAANAPSLSVMLLQADYQRAEAAASEWIADPTKLDAKKSAEKLLTEIAPQLTDAAKQLRNDISKGFDEVDRMPAGPSAESREREVRALEEVAGRAAYFAAWANYYLAVIEADPESSSIGESSKLFRGLLGFPESGYATVDPLQLGLTVEWRARALIGLGLCEAFDDKLDASRRAFEILRQSDASPQMIDQADYWFVRGLLNAKKYDAALAESQRLVNYFRGEGSEGKISLCALIAQIGFHPPADSPTATMRQLGLVGIVGLAKLGRVGAAIQLLDKNEIDVSGDPGFYLLWLEGQRQFAAAEKSKKERDYKEAKVLLVKAAASPPAGDASALAECEYVLGWCCYRLRQYAEASGAFRQAIAGLKLSNPQKAVESAWLAFVSLQSLAKNSPRYASAAIDVLEDIKRDFPNHAYAKKADLLIARLQQSRGSLRDSIEQLANIPSDDPNYLTAQYDLCVMLRQQIEQTIDESQKVAYAKRLLAAADVLSEKLNDQSSQTQRSRALRSRLMTVELAGDSLLPADVGDSGIRRADALAATLPSSDGAVAEYHHRALLLAEQRKRPVEILEHADWILANAPDSAFATSALVVQALDVDRRLQEKSTLETLNEAFEIYRQLTQRLGYSPQTLQAKKNARVAAGKFASYAEQIGRRADAAAVIANLTQAFPDDRTYLQQAGRAAFEAGMIEISLEHWRKLLLGLERGSDEWFEAKAFQLACLAKTDPPGARKVLAQFKLLYPAGGPAAWRDKIKSVEQELESSR
ncbi:MAG: tol-pal system YbgF family protein [Blastopirellula sp. JB062]